MESKRTHPLAGPQRILVDASYSFDKGINNGVQRVVEKICTHAKLASTGVARSISLKGDSFATTVLAEEKKRRERAHAFRADALSFAPAIYRRIASALCKTLPFSSVRNWLLPKPGSLGAFRIPAKILNWWIDRSDSRQDTTIGEGDLLILPDAYWAKEEIWPRIAEAKERGAKVAVVVYDLIPLTHPQFVPKKAPAAFEKYLHNVAEHADLIMAISETVREQVAAELAKSSKASPKLGSFNLGVDRKQPSQGSIRDSISQIFAESGEDTPHLMVATFDPRKNHEYALDAFEKIWLRDPTRKLCFIGREGWLCNGTLQRIRNHPRFGKQLFALHYVSDTELNYCYSRARSVIFPSVTEGFGLPIIEALSHGRHVFASDIPIHREVGKEDCQYCDLRDAQSLADLILQWENKHGIYSPSQESSFHPLSWEQSIISLIERSLQHLYPDPISCPCPNSRAA